MKHYLTIEQVNENKEEFIRLISSIEREGFKKDLLLSKFEASDWYIAPASTRYHSDYCGGLVEHSLNVYYNLINLIRLKGLEEKIDPDSVKIVALLHDISKVDFYEEDFRNVKKYCTDEEYEADKSKYKAFDERGHFCWEAVASYKIKDASERFIFGSHESSSEYMASQFIPLTREESTAILHHMGSLGYDSAKDDTSEIFRRYPLACLLFMADYLSSFIDEVVV